MGATVEDMIKAGALRQLCFYYDSVGGTKNEWEKVVQFAYREFRDEDSEVVRRLLQYAYHAHELAMACNGEAK